MSRNKGTFLFPANFQVKMQEALDPRVAVSAKADLINKETWPYDGDTLYLYNNMIVGTDEGVYRLLDVNKALNPDYSGWERIGGAEFKLEVVDNLTSEATDKALSANQGRVLMNEINSVAAKLTGIYSYKGSKATYEELPTDAQLGDVWNVEAAYGSHPAGTNYAWNGIEWDALAGSIDLSNYYTIEQVEDAIKVETQRATAKENEILELVNGVSAVANEAKAKAETTAEALTIAMGEVNTELAAIGERVDAIEQKNDAQDVRLTNLEKLIAGSEGGEVGSTVMEMVSANTQAIEELQENDKVIEASVDKLNGDENTDGSVAKAISDAFAWEDVV